LFSSETGGWCPCEPLSAFDLSFFPAFSPKSLLCYLWLFLLPFSKLKSFPLPFFFLETFILV
jgi:hypothetical protein